MTEKKAEIPAEIVEAIGAFAGASACLATVGESEPLIASWRERRANLYAAILTQLTAAESCCDKYALENQQLSDKADAALARAERAEKALEPFAFIAEDDFAGSVYEGRDDATDVLFSHHSGRQVTLGDFREAVSLLRSKG